MFISEWIKYGFYCGFQPNKTELHARLVKRIKFGKVLNTLIDDGWFVSTSRHTIALHHTNFKLCLKSLIIQRIHEVKQDLRAYYKCPNSYCELKGKRYGASDLHAICNTFRCPADTCVDGGYRKELAYHDNRHNMVVAQHKARQIRAIYNDLMKRLSTEETCEQKKVATKKKRRTRRRKKLPSLREINVRQHVDDIRMKDSEHQAKVAATLQERRNAIVTIPGIEIS